MGIATVQSVFRVLLCYAVGIVCRGGKKDVGNVVVRLLLCCK